MPRQPQYFNLILFRDGRMVQGEFMHHHNGTLAGAIKKAAELVESERLDRVSVESKSGTIVAVIKRKKS